jgi:hypothetical protein
VKSTNASRGKVNWKLLENKIGALALPGCRGQSAEVVRASSCVSGVPEARTVSA